MNAWSYEGFWNKAKVYIAHGNDVGEDNPLFPFWYFLALELLGRASLAYVHPALLADSKDDKNILYAFDRPVTRPSSISVSLVFQRCQSFVKGFTDDERKQCNTWMDLRNVEVHTGEPILHNLKTSQWLAEYYRICAILLEFQEKSLIDLFGASRAEAAQRAIDALKENVISKVKQLMNNAKIYCHQLTSDEISERKLLLDAKFNSADQDTRKLIECPVCQSQGILQGEVVDFGNTKINEGDVTLIRNISVLSTKFECIFCRFSIDGYAALHAAGIGGQYTVQQEEDMENYLSELSCFDPADDAYMDE